jgi:hypothetical protein
MWFFTCRKILRHTASSFTSHPKGGMLQIITLKNPSPRAGLNLWPLSPVASTFATTPPRRLVSSYCHIPAPLARREWGFSAP